MDDLDRVALEKMIIRNQSILDAHSKGMGIAALSQMSGLSEDYIGALIEGAGVKSAPTQESRPVVIPSTQNPENAKRNRAICDAYLSGTPPKLLAKVHGLSLPWIYSILNRYEVRLGTRIDIGITRPSSPEITLRNILICSQYQSGMTLEQVGQIHGITRERVRQILVKNGIEERLNGFFKAERIEARQRLFAAQTVAQDKRSARKAERDAARAMYDDGYSYEDIAKEMQHSIGWVQHAVWVTGGPNKRSTAGKAKTKLFPEQRADLARRYAANEGVSAIAARFDIHPQYVAAVAHQEGAYRPGFGPGVNVCQLNKKTKS